MKWKIEHVDGGLRLYYEGFYPLPNHLYPIWWPVKTSDIGWKGYVFKTLDDVLARIKEKQK